MTLKFSQSGNWSTEVRINLSNGKTEIGEAIIDASGPVAEIKRVLVNPPSKGYGTKLLLEVLKQAKRNNKFKLFTYINQNNEPSQGLFKKFGFLKTNQTGWETGYGSYWAKVI